MNRSPHWFLQAQSDLEAAKDSAAQGHFEWAAFAAQQAAEKAAKAVHLKDGTIVLGHSVRSMVADLAKRYTVPKDVQDAARRLDRHYVEARYPDAHPDGSPQDYYTSAEADEAVADAETVVNWCDQVLSS